MCNRNIISKIGLVDVKCMHVVLLQLSTIKCIEKPVTGIFNLALMHHKINLELQTCHNQEQHKY